MSGSVSVEYVLVTPFGARHYTCVHADGKVAADFVATLTRTYGSALLSLTTVPVAEAQEK